MELVLLEITRDQVPNQILGIFVPFAAFPVDGNISDPGSN